MLSNPVYDPFQILTKIYSDGAHVKQAIADTYIEEQYRSRTVKIVYGVLENDGYFDFCIRYYAPKAPKLAVRILLKISLYMLLFMDKKRYMVTDCAVTLCKKLGKSGVSGFVNAFLRRFDKEEVDKHLPQGIEGEAIKASYPLYAYKFLKKEYGDRAFAIASAKSAGVSVRFERDEEKYLERKHIKTPFKSNYIFENFVRDEGFDEGAYTFQSVGSIAICDCVEPCENLLDCCAAPGGKSVLLSKKCKQVTAFELHAHRVELIRQYCQRMGVENVTEFEKDSSVFDAVYEEKFDAVLCDAPCSGYGTISENPDIKLFRKETDFVALKKSQTDILNTVARYVKGGGALYYSTCSLFESENDKIIDAFLKTHAEYTKAEIDSPLPHEKKKYGLQFLPDTAYGAGFYVCKLVKKA
ncbi:MAG: methyltransferase domain-containing protein [Clostridiales bacterium]|nr:methyltransferase domain-containing protein [Clostridiales bacterium]